MISSPNSTLFILTINFTNQLQSICCASLTWVMNQMQQSHTFQNTTLIRPAGLALDNDLNMLIVAYGNSSIFIQQRYLTENMAGSTNSFTKKNTQPISYHAGFYYVGLTPPSSPAPYYFYVYSSSLSRANNMSFSGGSPQRAVWLYNDSLMCLILQQGLNSSLLILNWYSSPFNYILNRTISVPFNNPYGIAKSNDDKMIYISGNTTTTYQLSTTTFTWSVLVSNNNSTEIPMSLFVDSCGNRLWVLMLGFGIRVYDRINGNELGTWNMSTSYPSLYDMALTQYDEIYLVDNLMNQLIHYGSSLNGQCTIN